MRMDLPGGWERHSTTATKAAEIDFMNIKQLIGSISGTELQESTEGHSGGLEYGRVMVRNIYSDWN